MRSSKYTNDVRARRALNEYNHELEDREQRERQEELNLYGVSQRLMLERQDLEQKTAEIRQEFGKMARRKLVLEDEWKKLQIEKANLEEDKKRFNTARKSPWFQSCLLPTSDMRRVRIQVGGQLFETSEKVLKRDPNSLLAALVQDDSPIKQDENGCYIIDRDWYLFRHILTFLRDGKLPVLSDVESDQIIPCLYKEADYYHLESLRYAIREYLDPLHMVERSASIPLSRIHKLEATMSRMSLKADEGFLPTDPLNLSSSQTSKAKARDWWTDTEYNGVNFSSAINKSSPKQWQLYNMTNTSPETTYFNSSTWERDI